MDIVIKGVQKTSLIDYPGKVVAVVFLNRCNFRCPFCHNPELVLDETKDDVNLEEFMEYLEKKKGWLDGVCITGGEPTMHKGLPNFMKKLKKRNLLLKLDTNGTNPQMIQDIIDANLVDYIAMDIKASPEKYDKATAVKPNMDSIMKTVHIIMNSKLDYEFRTTVVPGLFDEEEAEKIGEWLKGAKKFCLQQFRNGDRVLDKNFQNIGHYHADKFEKYKEIISKYIDNIEIRGF